MTSHLPKSTGTVVGFVKNPKPFIVLPLQEGYVGEVTNRLPLQECLPRVRLTDCLRKRKNRRK